MNAKLQTALDALAGLTADEIVAVAQAALQGQTRCRNSLGGCTDPVYKDQPAPIPAGVMRCACRGLEHIDTCPLAGLHKRNR